MKYIYVILFLIFGWTSIAFAGYQDLATKKCAENNVKANEYFTSRSEPTAAMMPLEVYTHGKMALLCMFTDVLEEQFTPQCVTQCKDEGGLLLVTDENPLFDTGCQITEDYAIACRSDRTTIPSVKPVTLTDRTVLTEVETTATSRYSDTSAPTMMERAKQTLSQMLPLGSLVNTKAPAQTSSGVLAKQRINKANAALKAALQGEYQNFKAQIDAIDAAGRALGKATRDAETYYPRSAAQFAKESQEKFDASDRAYKKARIVMKHFGQTTKEFQEAKAQLPQLRKQLTAYSAFFEGYNNK